MDLDEEDASRPRRWLRLTVIVLAVVALIAVIAMMIGGGGGGHGPARHFSMIASLRALPVSIVEAGSWNQ